MPQVMISHDVIIFILSRIVYYCIIPYNVGQNYRCCFVMGHKNHLTVYLSI